MATTNKQDRQGARTPADLEQRYRFGESFAEAMGLAKDAQVVATAAKEATDKLDNSLNSDEIFNRLTENGALQGLYKEDGNLYINASYIKSGQIYTVYSKVFSAANYTTDDPLVMQEIMVGNITPTAEQMEKYDIIGDGVLTLNEVIYVRNMALSGEDITVSHKCLLNPSNPDEMIKVWVEVEKPSSTGVMTISEKVMFCAGVGTSVAPAIEDDTFHGCYYRVVDGEQEWINPPMEVGVEYRTTERWRNRPVYKKLVEFTNSEALSGTTAVNIPHGISNLSFVLSATTTTSGYLLPYVSSSTSLVISAWNATNLVAYNGSSSWGANRTWYIEMRYTKTT